MSLRFFKTSSNVMRVYKISSKNTDKIYIGKTTQKYLSTRFAVHNYHYKLHQKNLFNYISSFDVLKHGDCKIECLFICTDIEELNKKEKQFIWSNLDIAVNKRY